MGLNLRQLPTFLNRIQVLPTHCKQIPDMARASVQRNICVVLRRSMALSR